MRNFTQNIDTLEEVAGIQKVVYCHGSFATATCIGCKIKYSIEQLKQSMENSLIPYCDVCEEGVIKPDIVFFGEPLPSDFDMHLEKDVEEADCVIVIGSSMKVQPVSMIPDLISPSVPQILINRERLDHNFDIELLGDADVILGELARRLGWDILDEYDVANRIVPDVRFEEPNITVFSGCGVSPRPEIPEPMMDGSLFAQALSPVQVDPDLESLVQHHFPKPE